MSTKKVAMSWSGGKDSALALHALKTSDEYEIAALLTTITEDYDRVSMHGVRRALLEEQADSLGIPLVEVLIPKDSSNETYEQRMRLTLERLKAEGTSGVAFGDVFLEDLRRYREEKLALVEMAAVFPIWQRDTSELAGEFIESGFKAVVTCVDSQALDGSFVGRSYDRGFLCDLPADVDPCGENGEFHTFVHDGPIFDRPIGVAAGQVVVRDDRFYFCELVR